MSFRDPLHQHFYSVISVALQGFLPAVSQQMLSKSTCKLGHHIEKKAINIPQLVKCFNRCAFRIVL